MRILGLDPGSAVTGYGVLDSVEGELRHVAHGTLRPPRGLPLPDRLGWLHRGVGQVVEQHEPAVAVVEEVFVAASPRSALVLGQARGAVLAALAGRSLTVCEYTASHTKQAVTGDGRAGKRAVQRMVQRLLGLGQAPLAADAADALAAAICHAHGRSLRALGAGPRPRARGRSLRVRLAPR